MKKGKIIQRTFFICGILKDEFDKMYREYLHQLEFQEKKYEDKIIYFPRSMHKNPQILKKALQEAIEKEILAKEIILLYGFCGRATEGLKCENATLILPKFDDCINLLLFEGKRAARNLTEKESLYLTKGWSEDEESILGTCRNMEKNYPSDARAMLETIYGGYKKITILDTGSFDLELVKENACECKKSLDIQIEVRQSKLEIIKNLILGKYENEIIIKIPKNQVCAKDYEIN